MKTSLSVKIASLSLALTLLPTVAMAAQNCNGRGYIKAVYTNYWAFNYTGVVGIKVLHDNNQTKYYYTMESGTLSDATIRTIHQQANTAYISQIPVYIDVSNTCTLTTKLADGQTWIRRWSGITFE
jgi:hypothetical protein